MKIFALATLAALCIGAPVVASAQEDEAEVTQMAKEHYKLGLDAYKAGKYDVAIKELKKAYLLKRIPALLINIGATYRKMGDLDLAAHFYQKYLDEAPGEAKDRGEVEKILAELQGAKGEGAPAAGKGEGDPTPASKGQEGSPMPGSKARQWSHTVIDAAPPETPIDVRVSMPVMKGVKVWVYYRGPGENDFKSVLMKRHGREKIGRIPADAVTGKSLQYYIEARDRADTVVKTAGSEISPNVVLVDPEARPQMVASLEERVEEQEPDQVEEEEARPRRRAKPSRDLDDEAPTTGFLDDEEPGARKVKATGAKKRFGGLFWGGVGAAVVGVAGFALGGAGFVFAQQNASAVSADSRDPNDPTKPPAQPFRFNDPNAVDQDGNPVQNDAEFEKTGKLWNTIGIAGMAVGGVALAAGVAMIAAHEIMAMPKKPKKKRRRRVIYEDDEEEASAAPWYIAPTVGPRQVGLGGGFSF